MENEFKRAGMGRLLPELLASYANSGFRPGSEGGGSSDTLTVDSKMQLNPKQQEVSCSWFCQQVGCGTHTT